MMAAAAASAEVPAVSGRTVHRGPAVRPGGSGESEQVHNYIYMLIRKKNVAVHL